MRADEQMSYEQARDELFEVVQRLEAGATTLEESLALWERGEALADTCQQWLDGARARLAATSAADRPGRSAAAGGGTSSIDHTEATGASPTG